MNKAARIKRLLDSQYDKAPVQVWPAVVRSVEDTTCTVDILSTDLAGVPGVLLRADETAAEGLLLTPRVGSFVYVGVVENSLDTLYVCQVSEVDRVKIVIDKATLTIDKTGVVGAVDGVQIDLTDKAVTLKQDGTTVELKGGKVSIKNAGSSLKALLDELADLISGLKVITPVQGVPTPSTALDPGTLTKLPKFKTGVAALLQ